MSIALPYTLDGPEDYRIFSSGQGVYLYTADGRRLLDGLSGSMNANLGHGNAVIAAAMQEQALRLTSLPSIAGDVSKNSIALADKLCRILHTPDSACVFTSSGSEATEAALAVIWKYWSDAGQPSRTKILSLDGSYHGCTLGALAITGRSLPGNAWISRPRSSLTVGWPCPPGSLTTPRAYRARWKES